MSRRKLVPIIAILLALTSTLAFGQNLLSESRRSSVELFVYKLNEKDVRELYLKGKDLNESMLHTLVAKCAEVKNIPALPRGNYIRVRVVDGKLEYSDHTIDNFYHNVVKGEKVMLLLSDTLGNIIDNAVVRRGIKRLSFDKTSQTYNTSRVGDEKIVEVNNGGVLHYIEFEKEYDYRYRNSLFRISWYKIKNGFNRVFAPDRAPKRIKYNGFVVFSKPKYKPGEVVKFKAYINSRGRPYNGDTEVSLVSYYPMASDTTLTVLSPYRPGMYEWEFTLSDSLKLHLDNNYRIVLKTKGKHSNDISGGFYYEEYELGRITFDAKAERARYVKGDTVKLQLNAKDDNEMPVYDGRVNIIIRSSSRSPQYYSSRLFIPDEVWSHSLELSGKAPEEIVLPDSIFVDNTAINYDVECSFLDSGNERHDQRFSLYMDMRDRVIDFSVEKGILTMKELAGGESISAKAEIVAYNSEYEEVYCDSVMLPYSMPLLWIADNYEVTTETSYGDFYVEEIKDEIMGYRFFRERGSIRLVVDNPAKFPFWYTIKRGKTVIDRGYALELDYTRRDRGKSGYTMQLSYLLGEEAKVIQGGLPYAERNISMEVNMATTVYPGQTTTVDLLVKDKSGRPVKDADITAYAFTSKFGPYSSGVITFGKSVHGQSIQNKHYETYLDAPYNSKASMDWTLWRERMGLDSLEYYKFLYPETYYVCSGKVPGEETQISPYLVIDGSVQGVHILWIDEQPHYFYRAEQYDVYSFPVSHGYHTLKFRTHDREVTVENLYAEEGAKTIVSVKGGESAIYPNTALGRENRPLRVTVNRFDKKETGTLSDREVAVLKDHMATFDDTFGSVNFSNNQSIDLPAIVNAGGVYYYLNNVVSRRYDYRTRSSVTKPILAGPFPYRGFTTEGKNIGSLYIDTLFVGNFEIEGGYRYGIWRDYLKQTSWGETPFSSKIGAFSPALSFDAKALTAESIRDIFHKRIVDRAQGSTGLMIRTALDGDCRLKLGIGEFAYKRELANPVLIRFTNLAERDSLKYVYFGLTRDFNKLPEGDYEIDMVFRDTTRYTTTVSLRGKGLNYLKIDSIRKEPVDSISRNMFNLLYSSLLISMPSNPLPDYPLHDNKESTVSVSAQTVGSFNSANYTSKVITGTVTDSNGEPLVAAMVAIRGRTISTSTDVNGQFRLPDTGSGDLLISYLGFVPVTTKIISGYDYKIALEEDSMALEEVVVVGYGTTKNRYLTGTTSMVNYSDTLGLSDALAGAAAGIMIRGASSPESPAPPPLIVIDGVPYNGALSDLSQSDLRSINVLKDASAVGLYGSRAANGVIMITTGGGTLPASVGGENEFPEGWSGANSLRTNFRDDAFWYPSLSTGKDGTLTFEVTYPDDMTSWNANFIAIGGRRQTATAQMNVRSFKPINAQLSVPQFAIAGDSLNVIGRLTNHLGDTVSVKRAIELREGLSEESISLSKSHVDTIPVIANDLDSIDITYSLKMESGYFDGERRSVPVYRQGVLESHGEFVVIGDTATYRFPTNPALGKVTVHAEASAMQSFLDELEKIDRYPYMCNEQMASKIKALLLKKRICEIFDMEFKEYDKIENLIRRLERNKNSDNLWGWWNQDKTELWISKQIVEAMLDAEAHGYSVNINKQTLFDALTGELNNRLSESGNRLSIANSRDIGKYFVKHDLFNLLDLFRKFDAKIDYVQYVQLISSLPDATMNDKLRSMQMQLYIDERPQIDSLLSLASETMMGSLYWSEKRREETGSVVPIDWRFGAFPVLPNISDTENTLIAYRILREIGGYEKELGKIRDYFFEMRKSGSWQNTYESSRIIETIMADVLKPGESFEEAGLTINGKQFGKFPMTTEFGAGETIEVSKSGSFPVFFTAYQQEWNSTPERAAKGFSVETVFCEKEDTVAVLEAGKSIDLKVKVTADSDAEYVMIEVPIPAGCSYESKGRGNFRVETHREYYKEKVAIFCNKLPKGDHEFTIKLIPRYTGSYHLNPAKAELMYYPTFFGRGDMRVSEIE